MATPDSAAAGRRAPRSARWLGAVGAAALVAAPVGWSVTDRLERDNDFCTSCHLAPDRPLHAALRVDFDARPAASLAAAHAAAGVAGRRDGFRCIDCHGGTGLVSRARVKLLAAKDAFWYVTGHFEEPDGMRWPLWDRDCTGCHPSFEESATPEWQSPPFHAVALHNVDLGVACVACHRVHDAGGDASAGFVVAEAVRVQCARCHSEYASGSAP